MQSPHHGRLSGREGSLEERAESVRRVYAISCASRCLSRCLNITLHRWLIGLIEYLPDKLSANHARRMAFLSLPKEQRAMYESIGFRDKLEAVDEGIRRCGHESYHLARGADVVAE